MFGSLFGNGSSQSSFVFAPPDVAVILHDPRFDENAMTYRIEVRQGVLPLSAGPCSLFIDALRSPLAPAAVAVG